jgi:Na+/melibiose symporter-like transporter
MDKVKRVLAMAGVILLVLMYLMTIVTAVTATDQSHDWFLASIVMTVIVPCFLYAVNLVINLTKQNEANNRMREQMYMEQMRQAMKQKEEKETENAQQ